MTLGVWAVVRSPNGEFLLVRHTYTPGWHFPGGGVELGQAVEAALADELTQETGLCVSGLGGNLILPFTSSYKHWPCEGQRPNISALWQPSLWTLSV